MESTKCMEYLIWVWDMPSGGSSLGLARRILVGFAYLDSYIQWLRLQVLQGLGNCEIQSSTVWLSISRTRQVDYCKWPSYRSDPGRRLLIP